MAEKKIVGRSIQKHDKESNWLLATNFVPKQGEIIVYDIDDTYSYERMKIGDGVTLVSALPFVDDAVKAAIEALSSTVDTVDNKVDNVSALVGDTAVSTQISNAVATKADLENGVYYVAAESSDGAVYTATVPNITALTAGVNFIMKPSTSSTTKGPTLNVNGLGAKYIRRRLSTGSTVDEGYTTSWISKNKPFRVMYDGTQWVVEGHNKPVAADIYGSISATTDINGNAIVDTYATKSELQSILPKVTTISLPAASWTGDAIPYSQVVTISSVTENSKIDLQPTASQIVELQDEDIALMAENDSGTVTVYALGDKPTTDYTMQVLITEVTTV